MAERTCAWKAGVFDVAESNVYRSWGMDIIGMTNLQEAKLAREAEICYATLALVTDYDCWHPGHDAVSVETVVEYLNKNVRNAQTILREAVKRLQDRRAELQMWLSAAACDLHRAKSLARGDNKEARSDHQKVPSVDRLGVHVSVSLKAPKGCSKGNDKL